MNACAAFVFRGEGDWKIASVDDWELDTISINGNEKVLGHRKIDNAICKIIKLSDGQVVAITK